MRIGLVELLLILLIASLTVGPSAALWVDRWMRRAQKTSAAAARRRAAQEAQREEVLQRFQKLSIVFVLCAAVALIWGLVLRPIEAAPTPYTAPDVRQETGAQNAAEGGVLELAPYTEISALREQHPDLFRRALALEDNARQTLKTVKGLGRNYSWRERFGKEFCTHGNC